MMTRFRVEVWEISSYNMYVHADSAEQAQTEANRILEETSPEDYGADYGDKWTDVMDAEAM